MKALNFLLTIGQKNISHKAVKSFDMERNFSDIANKFSITLIDHPSVALTDLELYMAQGYRSCVFSYSDSSTQSIYQKFSGQIWDYDCTFVGDIKQLTITGYASRTNGIDTSGSYTYNIDWNSYYNRRADETMPWNCLYSYSYKMGMLQQYTNVVAENPDQDFFLNSATSSRYFLESYNRNSLFVAIKGPVHQIAIPIPDSFTTMQPHIYKTDPDTGEEDTSVDYGDVKDPDNKFWGELEEKTLKLPTKSFSFSINDSVEENMKYMYEAAESVKVWVEKGTEIIRGFQLSSDSSPVIQLNPTKKYFGAGQLLYSQTGVDISYIVKQLARLEGWKVGRIVQTELVPCDDKFKMQNQSALQFINDVLIPSAVTPVGEYTVIGDSGPTTKVIDKSYGGFHLYWDNGLLYFEPLAETLQRHSTGATAGIKFGYNVKNSPVISFKVDTKGTSFYTTSTATFNSMTITTGVETTETVVSDKSAVENLNKTKGHSEALDNYFGYTYEQIKDLYGNKAGNSAQGWIGIPNNCAYVGNDELLSDLGNKLYQSNLVQSGLVNQVPSSAISGDKQSFATLNEVIEHISNFTIQATMNLWGDADLSPNTTIDIINMVKSTNGNMSEVHPTSGRYLIWKQKDSFDNDQYIQQLSLLRYNDKLNINPEKIDWSKSFKAVEGALDVEETSSNPSAAAGAGLGSLLPSEPQDNTPSYSGYPNGIISYPNKDEQIAASTGKGPMLSYEDKFRNQNTSKSSTFGNVGGGK